MNIGSRYGRRSPFQEKAVRHLFWLVVLSEVVRRGRSLVVHRSLVGDAPLRRGLVVRDAPHSRGLVRDALLVLYILDIKNLQPLLKLFIGALQLLDFLLEHHYCCLRILICGF